MLIVEDETLIALHLELMVESLGHRVCAIVAAPDEAASAAARWAPDLALVDLRLAGDTSGIDAVRGLRRWWQGIGVVFVSANLDPATRAELGMLEPLAMVAKPIVNGELADALAVAARSRGLAAADSARRVLN